MGQPLLTYPLNSGVDSGIRQEVPAGFVSEYECRETARFVLLSWQQWLDTDLDSRAKAIAHKRISNAIEANVYDAHQKHNERLARRNRRR